MLDLILDATRLQSPVTAGLYTDVALPVTEGVAGDDVLQYFVLVLGAKSASTALDFRLDHGPDGRTTKVHTASLFSGTVAPGDLKAGLSGSAMRMDFAHPVLRVGSSGTGDQWVVVKVWQHRKRFADVGVIGATRSLGVYRVDSSATANNPGIALPHNDQGSRRRVCQYWMEVKEASASAQLGIEIQTGPNGQNWGQNKAASVAAVSAGNLYVVDCDTTKPLGPYFRPVLHTQSTAGERVQVEVWELSKSV